jgi:BirA family transcriptional regulator, biotin operon repressor / biotin---[acetyl-CoA-carboxylase] ligase
MIAIFMIIFGSSFYSYTQVPSTMDTARELLRAGSATAGTIVTAQSQSAGRGRQGKPWHSATGSLHLTAIGSPVAPTLRWQIPLMTALAVAQCIANVANLAPNTPIYIRFPNDLYLNHKKCGGILIEFEKDTPLIGIGLNLTHTPPEMTHIATHLPDLPLPTVQTELCSTLTTVWNAWAGGDFAALLNQWHTFLGPYERLFTLPDGSQTLARVTQVTPEGMVFLETAEGTAQIFHIAALSLAL